MNRQAIERCDQTPPTYSEDAEISIITICCQNPEGIKKATKIIPEASYFGDTRCQQVYGTMLKLMEDNVSVDLNSVVKELKQNSLLDRVGGIRFLSDKFDKVADENLEPYCNEVMEWYFKRETYQILKQSQSQHWRTSYSKDDLVMDCNRVLAIHSNISNIRDGWPEISGRRKLKPLPPPPIESMPVVLGDMAKEIAETFQVPIEVAMLNTLATAGFAAGGWYRATIKPGVYGRANIYAMTFARPGDRKTSSFGPAVAPINRWIAERMPEWRYAETDAQIVEGKIQKLRKKIIDGHKPEESEALRRELAELENIPKPKNPNCLIGDATEEAIIRELSNCGGRLGLFSSDAKNLLNIILGKYTDGKTQDGTLLKGYDGETINPSRISSGRILIENPTLGVCIMTQVDQIQKIGKQPDLFHGGLMSRFIVCAPDSFAGMRGPDGELLRRFDDQRSICPEVQKKYDYLITLFMDESSVMTKYHDVPVDQEAKAVFADYYNQVESELGPHGEFEGFADVAVRFSTNALRIALVSCLCRGGYLTVNADDMRNAISIMEYFTHHTERALGLMDRDGMPDEPRTMLRDIKRNNRRSFQSKEIEANTGMKSADAAKAIEWLIEHGYIRLAVNQPAYSGTGRKPQPKYDVNPEVFNEKQV